MKRIFGEQKGRVSEGCDGFFKGDAMFDGIGFGFVVVPLEAYLQYIPKLLISAIVIAMWLCEHFDRI
jgi:hypothetical protein